MFRFQVSGFSFFLFLTAVFFAASIHAEPAALGDSDKPIEITADSLEVIQPQRTATFKGNVKAVQGNVVLNADAMTVHYREQDERKQAGLDNAVSRIVATGKVFLSTPGETASGAKGIYDVDAKKVYLSDNVVLTRGENVLKGSKLVYDFAKGQSVVTAGGQEDGGRVKAVFVPKNAN